MHLFILHDSDSHSLVSSSATPWTNSLPGFSVHGIIQARILEWAAISFLPGRIKVRPEGQSEV